jgi:hypothetical protein
MAVIEAFITVIRIIMMNTDPTEYEEHMTSMCWSIEAIVRECCSTNFDHHNHSCGSGSTNSNNSNSITTSTNQ